MALTLDAAGLAGAIGLEADSAVAVRLLPVVTERIERYAPSAPDAMQDEAAIRFAAYLNAAAPTPNVALGSVGIGDISTASQGAHSHAGAFRTSGAKGLLSPWRIRRGAVADA